MSKTTRELILIKSLEKVNAEVQYTHASSYDGRRQTICMIKIKDKFFRGISVVSKKDFFDKKIGRVVSLGRAYKNYKDDEHVVPEEFWRFVGDNKVRGKIRKWQE